MRKQIVVKLVRFSSDDTFQIKRLENAVTIEINRKIFNKGDFLQLKEAEELNRREFVKVIVE